MFHSLLEVLYPPCCAACDAPLRDGEPAPFCRTCAESSLQRLPDAACSRCSEALSEAPARGAAEPTLCARCLRSPPAFARAWSPFLHGGVLRDALARMKFGGREDLCGPLASCLAENLSAHAAALGQPVVVVPVPLHPSRLAQRGFDQATPFARAVARVLGVPFRRALRRVRATPPQSRLSAAARRANVHDAFASVARVPPGAVVLVDDVLTTGATASACAACLLAAGAERVVVVTLARATSLDD